MKIEYRDGLLFTSLEIMYRGKSVCINNIVIDTGASQTLISQDCVEIIGIKVSGEDEVITSYGIGGKEHAFIKKVDQVIIDSYSIKNISLDFTGFQYDGINGLLGLDILLQAGFIIDVKGLLMYRGE